MFSRKYAQPVIGFLSVILTSRFPANGSPAMKILHTSYCQELCTENQAAIRCSSIPSSIPLIFKKPGVEPSYHIDYAGIIPSKPVFSGPISSISTPKSALLRIRNKTTRGVQTLLSRRLSSQHVPCSVKFSCNEILKFLSKKPTIAL
jgi:hypothetical protein